MAFQDTSSNGPNDRPLDVSVAGGIASVTIDRPAKMNAVTKQMWRELAVIFKRLSDDATVRVIILGGSGANFCAGADIGEFDEVRRDAATARHYEEANVAAFAALRDAPMPTVAAIRGACLGGGFGLAAACDMRLATGDAFFAVPAARLGLAYPQAAMADIVHSCGPQMARYLAFTGARIDAGPALAAGFLLKIVETATFEDDVRRIAGKIAENAPLSLRASKAAIRAALSRDPEEAASARRLGDETFDSADYIEGRAAFLDRRKPNFSGE